MTPVNIFRAAVANRTAYLYLSFSTPFDELPELVQKQFSQKKKVLSFDLDKKSSLANADIVSVKTAVLSTGYYLQTISNEAIDEQVLRTL